MHYAAICSPPCQNDGECTQPNTCQCDTSLWKGDFCEIGELAKYIGILSKLQFILSLAVCRPPCLNGGECYRPLTMDRCRCIEGWSGDRCETRMWCWMPIYCMYIDLICFTAVCNPGCENGGRCEEPGVCTCQTEWTGKSCEQGKHIKLQYVDFDNMHSFFL